ncbi:MAG: DNA polymerase IV, partial [Myxococcales bacterium]|nr:DNA polymerase IV [Myxococcales bacterium]
MPVAPDRWPRIIVHADMDAFYAAIEQLDDPALRGKPILIGGRSNRSVVATASYEARPFGVGSAMPMALALRKCPDAIVVRPRFTRYVEVSRIVMEVFRDFAAKVEPLSLDEAFLDMSGAEGIFGSPTEMGRALKAAVFEATGGLNVSVGVSGTKFVAKVASDFDKPDGLTVVPPADMVDFLAPLPVKRLWGAGPKTVPRLEALGLRTIGDVARAELGWLEAKLGSAGAHFGRLARADDPREVTPGREA